MRPYQFPCQTWSHYLSNPCIPDKDYGSGNVDFMDDVTRLIKDAFFSEEPFAQDIRPHRNMWNFYITYQQGDAEPYCFRTLPPNWTTMSATVDSEVEPAHTVSFDKGADT